MTENLSIVEKPEVDEAGLGQRIEREPTLMAR
jgi:hypothetical protein